MPSEGYINSEGSGTLWDFGNDFGYAVVTNKHVVTTKDCYVLPENDYGEYKFYDLDPVEYRYNPYTDSAILKIKNPDKELNINLNYQISKLPLCDQRVERGTDITIIGYPAYTSKGKEMVSGIIGYTSSKLTISEGIISSYDTDVDKNLPYDNYFISAKIDSGNSGGIALVEKDNGFCVLGIPTWLNLGNYETQGIVQNIHNIFYIE